MTATKMILDNKRVLSGMRSTGHMHLGNYYGALKNWIKLQHEYDCFFFAADWHALTTHYDETASIEDMTKRMIVDWLAAGLNPKACKIFVQSQVPEQAELHLLLSMIVPLGWLERVPTYKEQQENLGNKDLSTYGFLGYPLLQSADILAYKAGLVPVGDDQVAHIELTREIARRFNFLYGREKDFQERAEEIIDKMGKKNAKLFRAFMKSYKEHGDHEALEKGQALLTTQVNLTVGDEERLYGYLEGGGKVILPEPEVLLSNVTKMPGLDGRKMSKSYNNTIGLTEEPESVELKIKRMPTDPARVRRSDPGDPAKCPVWGLHQVYASTETKKWVQQGCTSAGIGCLECKGPLIESIIKEQEPIRERAKEYTNDPSLVMNILQEGAEEARDIVRSTLKDVKSAIGITYNE